MTTPVDLPPGVYDIGFGFWAVVSDTSESLSPAPRRSEKCARTGFSVATCLCWECRGESVNPVPSELRGTRR